VQRRRRIPSELHRRLRRRLLEIADRVRRARAGHLCGRLAQPEATKRVVVSVSFSTHMLALFHFFYVGTVRARQAAAQSRAATCLGRACCMDVFLDVRARSSSSSSGSPKKTKGVLDCDESSDDYQFGVVFAHQVSGSKFDVALQIHHQARTCAANATAHCR